MEGLAKRISEAGLLKVHDVLKYVIAEWILDQVKRVLSDLLDEMGSLVTNSMVDATLKDTAAMAVGADSDAIIAHGAEDELSVLCIELVQTFLNDMIAIEVLNQIHHLAIQGINDSANLFGCLDEVNHLLQSTCSMAVECNFDHIWSCIVNQLSALIIVGILQQLLAEVVAKRI